MHNQQFSAHIIETPLQNVLTTLASHAPFRFIIKGNAKNDVISSSFHHLSFKESLERLLLGYDYAIIQNQHPQAFQTSELPYIMEVVVLSRNPAEPYSTKVRSSLVNPQSFSTQPLLLEASNNLNKSDQVKPLELEKSNEESNFQETVEEALQDIDPESLALVKELLEE